MKQIIQSFKTGETILEEVPAPAVRRGCVLIKTTRSLVSLGTERMLVEFGKANLFQKARQQPDRVKQVWDKVKTDGLKPTLNAVFNKLGQPLPLGYSNVGRVIAVGEGVNDFKIGDRVASNGHHAEFVCVPKHLCAHIPDSVTDEAAAFTVIGSIGLQGIRLCDPKLGETIIVTGLGLIGLITAELLAANGCRVIGIDPDLNKLALARKKGILAVSPADTDVVKYVLENTGNNGADGVIITASVKGDEVISQAAKMSRKRGRVILVGVIGLGISRADFYEKELTFQVSCSYGPGRYDDNYEKAGIDYPLPFVRWTEQRNFGAVLQTISSGRLDVASLITDRVPLGEYGRIYNNMANRDAIASILEYPEESNPVQTVAIGSGSFTSGAKGGIGIIGAGNFTSMTMLPILAEIHAPLTSIASASGVTGTALARKYRIARSTTDYKSMLADPETDMVMITTRHNEHAHMVVESLLAGKHVFVEKPLALNKVELDEIIAAHKGAKTLTVGFNRRFSPHMQKVKQLIGDSQMNVIATMNAGNIPANVWVHDLKVGGGRIIGEACHYIDLITFLTGSRIKAVCMNAMGINPPANTDNASILLQYENGSTGVINYFANGSKTYSKERIEVYSQERTIITDNFMLTEAYGTKNFSKLKTNVDKGHTAQFRLLVDRVRNGGAALIPFDELVNTTLAGFAAVESLVKREWVSVRP